MINAKISNIKSSIVERNSVSNAVNERQDQVREEVAIALQQLTEISNLMSAEIKHMGNELNSLKRN